MALRCRVTADYDCKVALIPAIDANVRNEGFQLRRDLLAL